jgi:Na+/proline symporter
MNAHKTSTASHLNRGAGVAAIFAAGLLHAFITPQYVKEKLYIGTSFGISFVLCTIVAAWLWSRPSRNAWIAGALLTGGMIAGFLLSRTIGLPGFNESGVWDHWKEGFPALAAELGFLALAIRPILTHTVHAPGTTRSDVTGNREFVSR